MPRLLYEWLFSLKIPRFYSGIKIVLANINNYRRFLLSDNSLAFYILLEPVFRSAVLNGAITKEIRANGLAGVYLLGRVQITGLIGDFKLKYFKKRKKKSPFQPFLLWTIG